MSSVASTATDSRRPELSVVVPCFRDADRIDEIHRAVDRALDTAVVAWELILVDDGSRDGTYEAIRRLHARDPGRVVGVRLARNHGQHLALCAGMSLARGRFVATWDSDLDVGAEHLPALLERARATRADVVVAVRRSRAASPVRSAGSRIFNRLYARCLGGGESDVGSMFRVYRSESARTLLRSGTKRHYLPAAASWSGLAATEVEVPCRGEGPSRPSRYRLGRLIGLAVDFYFEYTDLPLRVAVYVGLAMLGLGLAGFTSLAVYRLLYGPGISGLALLVAFLFLLAGLQFLLLGVIVFYVYRLATRPPEPGFVVHETTLEPARTQAAP